MTRSEVSQTIGSPERTVDDDIMESIYEYRDNVEYDFQYEDEKKLSAITFQKYHTVFFNDYDIFNTPNIIDILKQIAPTCFGGGHYIDFPALGIVFGGFTKRRIPEGKLIIVYGLNRDFTDFDEV